MPTTARRISTALFAAALLAFAVTASAATLAITPAAEAATLGDRVLRSGSTGSDVKALQRLLSSVGIKATADGEFGSGTKSSVLRFQRWAKLQPSGSVGPRTIEALNAAIAAGQTVTNTKSAGGASMNLDVAAPDGGDVPVTNARLASDGTAIAPANAPDQVKAIIDAGNEIASKPYVYGGGHGSWKASGYDCSGSVSYALHGAGLLKTSMASGEFTSWGKPGKGTWVTIYANGGHMYMYVAGLRFDTSGANPSRWQKATRSNSGFTVRHIAGL